MEEISNYFAQKKYPLVKNIDETIGKIIEGKYSIARFGDGEFYLSMGRPIGFQEADRSLQKKMVAILKSGSTNKCLVAIPEFRITHLTPFWKRFWYENIEGITSFFKPGEVYYNQSITREGSVLQMQQLKKVWQGRNVIFVLGKGGRFNIRHELFDNIVGSEIIYGDSKNAWKNYASVVSEVRQKAVRTDNPIVICALGPTATVLAFELGNEGIQTMDIGHLTNVYDNLVYGGKKPEEI